MPGFTRRPKPLKARVSIDDLNFAEISNLADGDILVYDSADGVLKNTQVLDGTYTFTQGITGTTLTLSGALAAGAITATGALTVLGATSLQALTVQGAATLNSTLHVIGAATFDSTVTITGTLSFAGFSVSGDGSIGGSLTVSNDITVSDDLVVGDDLTVAGDTTLHQLVVVGNEFVTGALTVTGNIVGNQLAGAVVSAVTGNFTTVNIGAAVYTNNGITFEDDATSIDLYNGTQLILSLDTVGVIEVATDPNAATSANTGALALRTDTGSLYVKRYGTGAQGWIELTDQAGNVEWLFMQLDMLKTALSNVVNADGSVGIVIEGDA
jgi:cytoskeletal protein CcmA (bactofilin family)